MPRYAKRKFQEAQAARAIALAADKRDDMRADVIVTHGPRASAYAGHTPHQVDGAPTFGARVAQTRMTSVDGSTRRSGKKGTLVLVRPRLDTGAPKHGGAHMLASERLVGDRIVVDTQPTLRVRHPTIGVVATRAPEARQSTRGNDDAPLYDTDPGDHPETVASDRYWRDRRRERGDWRAEDFDAEGNVIP